MPILANMTAVTYSPLELTLGMLGFLIGQIILLCYPRAMIYRSAFEGMSRNRKKKILKETSFGQKLLLFFTLEYKNRESTRIRLIVYYVELIWGIVVDILILVRDWHPEIQKGVYPIIAAWMIFCIVIMMFDVFEGRKKKRKK